jgi:SAM-dependent methyltransferase
MEPSGASAVNEGGAEECEVDREIREMFDRMPLGEGAAFLDVGCGDGPALARAWRSSPRAIVGVDLDRRALRLAAQRAERDRVRCWLVQADAVRLPFKAESFSHVCCRLVLPYVDQHAAIVEVSRVLRRQGAIFLQLHPWRFYAHLFLADWRRWKRAVLNGFCLANGLWFHLTGRQWSVPVRAGRYRELFQTEARMRRLLLRAAIVVRWVDNSRLFRILGAKQDGGRT